ncbi:MAG: hypothetical protein NZ750_03770 [Anaerolineae bacterium]|nr:hypothetical protein [Anaerolineae bacterium]MDW8171440.1 hypothetical protein [Anaerolineae bacterium]
MPFTTDEQPARTISGTQVMFAVIVALALMLTVNFSGRVSADRQLRAIRDTVLREIDLLKREQGELIARLAYVQSDAYVSDWARSEAKMVRDGEVLILPVPMSATSAEDDQPAVTEFAPPQTRQQQPENWQLWWALFFDSPPPVLN